MAKARRAVSPARRHKPVAGAGCTPIARTPMVGRKLVWRVAMRRHCLVPLKNRSVRLHESRPMEFFGKDSWSFIGMPVGDNFCSLGSFFELDLLKKQIGHQSPQP